MLRTTVSGIRDLLRVEVKRNDILNVFKAKADAAYKTILV